MEVLRIPAEVFSRMSKNGEIIDLPTVYIGHSIVHRKICRIIMPQVGNDCGWLRYICSIDGSFDVCGLELHPTEESAKFHDYSKISPNMITAIFVVKMTYYTPSYIGRTAVNHNIGIDSPAFFLADELARIASLLEE